MDSFVIKLRKSRRHAARAATAFAGETRDAAAKLGVALSRESRSWVAYFGGRARSLSSLDAAWLERGPLRFERGLLHGVATALAELQGRVTQRLVHLEGRAESLTARKPRDRKRSSASRRSPRRKRASNDTSRVPPSDAAA